MVRGQCHRLFTGVAAFELNVLSAPAGRHAGPIPPRIINAVTVSSACTTNTLAWGRSLANSDAYWRRSNSGPEGIPLPPRTTMASTGPVHSPPAWPNQRCAWKGSRGEGQDQQQQCERTESGDHEAAQRRTITLSAGRMSMPRVGRRSDQRAMPGR